MIKPSPSLLWNMTIIRGGRPNIISLIFRDVVETPIPIDYVSEVIDAIKKRLFAVDSG